ncbi:MAG: hypothetical protein LBI90_09360 [Treponema sp.]|jgi:hypothetical protein|nr:hypothetical protein [Treponema sp.]
MTKEFADIVFHSIRLEDRCVRTMETLIKQPDKSIWEASEDRAEAKAIYRMLEMNSEAVHTAEEAYEYAGYYMQRWKIERFHYVLKSGCAIEKLQERSIEKSTALIVMYSIIAVMIMNMTYAARLTPDAPCSLLLGEAEWKLLYCIANKSKKEPKRPYTMKEAINYLGWLGGPSQSKNDMDRAYEAVHPAGIPGVPRMIPWVKFRA